MFFKKNASKKAWISIGLMEYGHWHLFVWYQRQKRHHAARSHLIEYFRIKTIADKRHLQYIGDYLITQNIELTVAWIRHKSDHVEWLSTRFRVIVWLVFPLDGKCIHTKCVPLQTVQTRAFLRTNTIIHCERNNKWMEEKNNKSSTHRTGESFVFSRE